MLRVAAAPTRPQITRKLLLSLRRDKSAGSNPAGLIINTAFGKRATGCEPIAHPPNNPHTTRGSTRYTVRSGVHERISARGGVIICSHMGPCSSLRERYAAIFLH